MLDFVSGNAKSTNPNEISLSMLLTETISVSVNGIILLKAPGSTSSWQNSPSCRVDIRRPNNVQNVANIGTTKLMSL